MAVLRFAQLVPAHAAGYARPDSYFIQDMLKRMMELSNAKGLREIIRTITS